jgi:branched-subunit amino acid ABC-type transport system permease component
MAFVALAICEFVRMYRQITPALQYFMNYILVVVVLASFLGGPRSALGSHASGLLIGVIVALMVRSKAEAFAEIIALKTKPRSSPPGQR